MSAPDSQLGGKPVQPKKAKRKPDRSRGEAVYLGALTAIAFLAAVGFLLLTAWAIFVPAMGIAFLFGIVVATLAYAFLGSKGHDEVRIRGVQLGGAVAVVAGLVLITNGPLERQLDLLQRLEETTARARAGEERARIAEERANRELIVERGLPQAIVSGGQIALEDVNSLNGLSEGPHRVNVGRVDAAHVFETLFRRLDIQASAAQALAMTEDQWQDFLRGLPDGKRLQLGGIPFARLTIQASDGTMQTRTVFKHDVVPVLNQRGQAEAYLCIRRVLDVRERRSDEAEIVVLTHSRVRCR